MSGNMPAIDRRALRTRNRIATAVMRLGALHDVDKLTVGELAREAGVSRSTFYAHFGSLEQYFTQSFANMLAGMAAHSATEDRAGEHLLPVRRILDHVAGAPEYVAEISRSKYRPMMFAAGEDRLARHVEARLADQRPGLRAPQRAATARFVAAGFLGMLRDWMENGMRRAPHEFEREFVALVARI